MIGGVVGSGPFSSRQDSVDLMQGRVGYAQGSLLSVGDLSVAEVSAVLRVTAELEAMPRAERVKVLAAKHRESSPRPWPARS